MADSLSVIFLFNHVNQPAQVVGIELFFLYKV